MEKHYINMPAEIHSWEENKIEGFLDLMEKSGALIDRTKIMQVKGIFASERFGFVGTGYSLGIGAIILREGLRMPYCGMDGIIHYLKQTKMKMIVRMAFHNPSNAYDYFFLFLTESDRRVVPNIDLGSWQ